MWIINMPKNHNIIEISGEIFHETGSAYLFSDGIIQVGKLRAERIWLPKSQCEWDSRDNTMQMPEWLGLEKGFI